MLNQCFNVGGKDFTSGITVIRFFWVTFNRRRCKFRFAQWIIVLDVTINGFEIKNSLLRRHSLIKMRQRIINLLLAFMQIINLIN